MNNPGAPASAHRTRRLLYVVQRYGTEVAGGAELACRSFATRMAGRGHSVEVVTSCARSYVDWANDYPEGSEEVDGVTLHRLPTTRRRDLRLFGPLDARVLGGKKPLALHVQQEWMRAQGPAVEGLPGWLAERAASFDAVVFFTYLYWTTWAGLPAAAARTATVLHPTAHDEPSLSLSLFDATFRLPRALAFLTSEEAALVRGRFRVSPPSAVTGVGFDLDEPAVTAGGEFRERFGLGDDPYLVSVGRVDASKGSGELVEFFAAYKQRRPGRLRLVVVGEEVQALGDHAGVVATGFVDDATKRAAIAGALALVQPSYYESFSMVLMEAWLERRPALVQGHCAVLAGHARRSGGALAYSGYPEFEAALDELVADEALASALGESGRRYVEANYAWDGVLDRYERLLAAAV